VTRRYRITVEYHGAAYAGWQRQDGPRSVQQALEEAILKISHETVTVTAAGRTDSGVHALGQVCHFDLDRDWEPGRLREAMNGVLRAAGDRVSVLDCAVCAADFHARFSAVSRSYLYRILNRRAPPALDAGRVWHVSRPLDAEAMAQAAAHLLGKHDFSTFRAAECQAKSPVKTLDRLDVARHGEEIHIEAFSRSFLHSQVRSMTGSLKLVGEGKWTPADMKHALEARDRKACGPVAPACGLYLVSVGY
jgi:tRNA pseudouridine38-40 synthase